MSQNGPNREKEIDWDTEIAKDMTSPRDDYKHAWLMEVYKRDTEMYKLASEHFRQDLREFWSRTGMYMLSQAFLFAAFAALVAQSTVVDKAEIRPHWHDVVFEIILGTIGALVAWNGCKVADASKRWIHGWRDQMLRLDKDLDRYHSYCTVEISDKEQRKRWLEGSLEPLAYYRLLTDPPDNEEQRSSKKSPDNSTSVMGDPITLTAEVPKYLFYGWVAMTLVVVFAEIFSLIPPLHNFLSW